MGRSRTLALTVLCAAMMMIILDGTIVTVALPAIQKDLGFSASGLAWVINAYLIAFGGLLLLAGRVGDLVGRKKVFLAGLAIFTAASVVCGLSFAQPVLVVARFIQGIGGAVSSAVILAMIVTMFPEPLERAKAFGIFSFVASAGAAVGLIAGGLITQAVSWHWIFFVNLPIGVATAIAAARLIDNDRGIGLGQGADVPGALTVTGALMLGVYTIVQTSDHGLVSTRTLVLALVTGALLAAFVVRQARGRNPILPLRLFRSRLVSGANLAQGLMSISFLGFFFFGSLDMERVLGYGPMALGLAFLTVASVMSRFSIRFSAQLICRIGPYALMLCGLLVAGGALVMVAFGPTYPTYALNLMLPMALLGLGGGLCFPALTMLAMADVAPSDAGLASGLLNTTGQVGGAFGLAMLATIAGGRTLDLMRNGTDAVTALAGGFHFAWMVSAAIVLLTLAVAAWLLRPQRTVQIAAASIPDADCIECEAAA